MSWLSDVVGFLLRGRRSPTPPPRPPLPSPLSPTGEVARLLNAARARWSLAPLAEDPSCALMAEDHSNRMASFGQLSHQLPGEDSFGERARSWSAPGFRFAENISRGRPSPAEVVNAWLADGPHRDNIFGPYDWVGVG